MGAKINPDTGVTEKQDKFAQLVITEGCLSTAYRSAYDAGNMKSQTIWSKSHLLAAQGNVAARIEYWRERAAKKHEVTVESLTRELEEARELAKNTAQPSAMVSAIKEKAVLHGVRVEKTDNKTTVKADKSWRKALRDEGEDK